MSEDTASQALNERYVPSDEDRRRDALYQAVTIQSQHGQDHSADAVIATAAKLAAFVKGG